MALRHEELTSVILASIFEVHNDVGVGLDEALYHQSLLDCFLQNHYVQIISELKLWQKDLGLLVNFGRLKTEFERIPFDEKEKKVVEVFKHSARIASKFWQIESRNQSNSL
ncbi:GxxExxY protein [candidate division KSB1 bacterium]|nr:GxxExxY protein [candidate division KSB1 bacterium]